MSKKPIVLAVASDLHVGSTIGLTTPTVRLDDEGGYTASKAQQWLWANWLDFCKRAIDTADSWRADLVTVLNGDLTEGTHHGTTQLITANHSTQMRLAYEVIRPLVDHSERVYIVRGTPAHVGRSASLEERISDDLTNIARHSKSVASWWHLALDVHGTLFDIAHHGKLGRLPWTKPNAIASIAGQVTMNYIGTGDKVPNVVLRSHLHQYADTVNNFKHIRVIALPGWQLATAYVHRIAPGSVADTGGLIFTCWPNGRYDLEVVRYSPKRRKPERLK